MLWFYFKSTEMLQTVYCMSHHNLVKVLDLTQLYPSLYLILTSSFILTWRCTCREGILLIVLIYFVGACITFSQNNYAIKQSYNINVYCIIPQWKPGDRLSYFGLIVYTRSFAIACIVFSSFLSVFLDEKFFL